MTFDLPPIECLDDVIKAQNGVLQAVAKGDLTPGEGQRLIDMTEKTLKALKAKLKFIDDELKELEKDQDEG